MKTRNLLILAAFLSSTLTACGGGGGGSGAMTPPGGGGSSTLSSASTEDAISTADAVGSPVQDFANYNDATGSPLQSVGIRTESASPDTGSGTCNNGVEFYAPDRNGDPNSTETQFFYDNACTGLARDVIRIWTSTGAHSETVQRTSKMYALNSTTAYATRNEAVSFTNATFDQYGYPIVSGGFVRSQTGELDIAGARTIDQDGEFILAPSSGGSTTFCSDEAGYNETGYAALNETVGWTGLLPNGTRTVNGDGSVTWQATHSGSVSTGAIGALSIHIGTSNTACPISTPKFTLAGGTLKGSFNIPVSATFSRGVLTNLTITNATLLNGDTLNVTTSSTLPPPDPHFISGTLAKNGSTVATFNVNAFGDGVLTVTATGTQYVINDWHVVR